MIHLRKLDLKDTAGMLEWMHDDDIQQRFQVDMGNKTLGDVREFIERSQCSVADGGDVHLAIADERDEYLGTISLKHISLRDRHGEYAISLRRCAQGKGIATDATHQLLTISFRDWMLERVYLNVLSENTKAIHLYERCGFVYEGTFRKHICLKGEFKALKWYSILKEEYRFLPQYEALRLGGGKLRKRICGLTQSPSRMSGRIYIEEAA